MAASGTVYGTNCNDPMKSTGGLALEDWAVAFEFAHALFRRPTEEQFAWLAGTECGAIWKTLSVALGSLPEPLPLAPTHAEFESGYIMTFDAGAPTPLVPLLESHYNHRDPLPRILHENILFHRQFGLRLRPDAGESADHLRYQLEFLAALTRMRSRSSDAEEIEQFDRAIVDFADRHVLSWLPKAAEAASGAQLRMAEPALCLVVALTRELLATLRRS